VTFEHWDAEISLANKRTFRKQGFLLFFKCSLFIKNIKTQPYAYTEESKWKGDELVSTAPTLIRICIL